MMRKLLASLLTLILLISASWSQEDDASEATEVAAESETPPGDADVAEESDATEIDLDDFLDSQDYEEDEDEFVPTEEIPAGEPIPFPSNI